MECKLAGLESVIENSYKVVKISSKTTISEASAKMRSCGIGCLIVVDDSQKMVGLVTEKDIVTRALALKLDIEVTPVEDIMTRDIVFCSEDISLTKLQQIMTERRIRHLPVLRNGQVEKIFSISDVVEQHLLEDRFAAEQIAMLSTCLKSIDMNEVVEMISSEVPRLFGAKRCVLCIFEAGDDDLKLLIRSHHGCRASLDELKAFASLKTDTKNYYQYSGCKLCSECAGVKNLVIPLEISTPANEKTGAERHLVGYLGICDFKEGSFKDKSQLSYKAELIRDVLSSHLSNASLYQQVKTSSLTDTLTQVGSRELLENRLAAECSRAARYNGKFSVAIIDLDKFKTINDTLGHTTGDEALRKLANCMKKEKRTSDLVTRFGGDEFVILMPETTSSDARVFLERLRLRVQQIEMPQNFRLTISVGVVSQNGAEAGSYQELLRRADLALYEAKESGRNCVRTWEDVSEKLKNEKNCQNRTIRRLGDRVSALFLETKETFVHRAMEMVSDLGVKDPYMKSHCENVAKYSIAIARAMDTDKDQLEVIRRAALIHDIGKTGLPDGILFKTGRLTKEERSIVRQHPLIAVRVLNKMHFLDEEAAIVRWQCERLDGSGYPDGLKGSRIPFGARVLAVADIFDALTSDRPWRKSRSIDEALAVIGEHRGVKFDAAVVRALEKCIDRVQREFGIDYELAVEDLLNSQVFGADKVQLCFS